jgi:tetratricopeptide (TPR) repeat protein
MSKLFISHSSKDDSFVSDLRTALARHGQDGWIDSRELRGGDPLWSEIQKGIEAASAYAVVISPDGLQSKWVGKELRHALELQKERGKDRFPVIPLSLDGTRLGVLEEFFGEEPLYIPLSSDAGGVQAAINAILVAMGKRLPADVAPIPQPRTEALEELVLELGDLKFDHKDGIRRASARARLVYEPATPSQPHVHSEQVWRFIAPLGPIEADDLKWYLEKYAVWPSGIPVIRERARKVEENLIEWGKLLHQAAMPSAHVANVKEAWKAIQGPAGRRFSVHVDSALEVGAPEAEIETAQEVATILLGLPWELLHDGEAFLFQGAAPTRVRRRLPATKRFEVPVVATPIRILLVTARPEDEACAYIDHRASALPLVEAMEAMPGLVKIHVLSPPTLPALRDELDRARAQENPYHVVHFDGHGVYDRTVGLGGLCFEFPEDAQKLEKRRHVTIFTNELGPLLRDHRIPLVFLEACQTASAEKASESVASELLKVGVASVVAMSHSVLVETARRFVESFYKALADGKRVGDAMLAGQRQLKDDTFRGRVLGADELRLEDWFVPVLFQEKEDPQLFRTAPAKQTVADFKAELQRRQGELPPVPQTGFIGRSRELLALQRLLRHERYAVVRGQGGEGKTALAAEFGRWMVRSQQMRRAAFVSVATHSHVGAVLDALGPQLVGKDYSAANFGNLEQATLPVERELTEQATLLVMDNLESILVAPWLQTPEPLGEEGRRELDAVLALCARLNAKGDTRLVFTSREMLPAPFDAPRHRRELHQLEPEDAVKFVERVLDTGEGEGGIKATREEIEGLVETVHNHARTLMLLAPSLRSQGVAATRASLAQLMAEMERLFPGSREKSLFASVELSLRRLSEETRDRTHTLGVFFGGFNTAVLRLMMEWKEEDVLELAGNLVKVGLATSDSHNHFTLNPALCPYLRSRMSAEIREHLTARWVDAMLAYVGYLVKEYGQRPTIVAKLTALELPNLFALLDSVDHTGFADRTMELVMSLSTLVHGLAKPRLMRHLARVRDTTDEALGTSWSHARFLAASDRVKRELYEGRLREALQDSNKLLELARTAGDQSYIDADYDWAMAVNLRGEVLVATGASAQALELFDEAHQRFESIPNSRTTVNAEGMAATCIHRKGTCLLTLGRFDDAAVAYNEALRRNEKRQDARDAAFDKAQLGTVRLHQRRHAEAFALYEEARQLFMNLGDLRNVATAWHQIGIIHEHKGEAEEAEDAYRKALAIAVQIRNISAQAISLQHLGNLYKDHFDRDEEAVMLYRQAVEKNLLVGDIPSAAKAASGSALALRKLKHLDEARREIHRAIDLGREAGHSVAPWKFWNILTGIETDAGDFRAAANAKEHAIASFLAYRRDGGENQSGAGRISLAVTQALLAGDNATAASFLQQLSADPKAHGPLRTFVQAFQSIVDGSRDRTLADSQDLDYSMAAEILLLIETLEKSR